jgi:hypothetical protein
MILDLQIAQIVPVYTHEKLKNFGHNIHSILAIRLIWEPIPSTLKSFQFELCIALKFRPKYCIKI